MRITQPYPAVPGDNADEYTTTNGTLVRPRIMARSPQFRGVRGDEAVWVFGFMSGSEEARVYERAIFEVDEPNQYGLLWVRSTVKTGKVRETFRGWGTELPANFRRVIEEA